MPKFSFKKQTVAYLIKTAVCLLVFLGVMAAFSYLSRELADNYLLLILPQTGLTASWLIRLVIFVVCLAAAINITAVLVRPIWLVAISYLLAAVMYIIIMGVDKMTLIIAAVFFAGLLTRLMFVFKQLNNQVNFSVHPLADKNTFFFSLLALLVAAAFWFGYSQDMRRRVFIIAPEIKSAVLELSLAQVNNTIKNQHLQPAQEKVLLSAANSQVQKIFENVEKPLAPYARFVPLAFAAILFSFLSTIFSFLGLISLPILKMLFVAMRLAHFTNFAIETREIKRLTLKSADKN